MRAYLLTTGLVFALIALAHVWRVIAESRALAGDASFLVITALAAGLCVWAAVLWRRMSRGA